jgi:hypothetical protein
MGSLVCKSSNGEEFNDSYSKALVQQDRGLDDSTSPVNNDGPLWQWRGSDSGTPLARLGEIKKIDP